MRASAGGASSLPPEAIAFASRMFDAARTGQTEVFQQALPAGLPANLTNDKGDTLVSLYAFFLAAFRRRVPFQPRESNLCNTGLKPIVRAQVMLAAYHGHAELVSLLLAQGAEPNTLNDRGQSPLAGAVFKNEEKVVDALLEGGADPEWGDPSAMEALELFKMEGWRGKFEAASGRGKMKESRSDGA